MTGRRAAHRVAARRREQQLALRYHRTGDLSAREELIVRFMPLARDLALRYRYTDEPIDDLTQVAFLGLTKAVDRYEPGRGPRFPSYAVPTILGELKRYFRDKGWSLHVPRELQERTLAVNRATDRLATKLGRSPTVKEVGEAVGCSSEQVLEAMEAARTYDSASLNASVRGEDDSTALVEMLGSSDDGFELVEERETIARAWNGLPEAERRVLVLRFVEDLTQREIGERVGFSQMHVSRLLRRALGRLEEDARVAA
jgi:RNA polymerase sigma-B factor